MIRYKRDDGVDLTATLFTPPGWDASQGPLPCIFWAYPVEFKSKSAAGQMRESPFEFSGIGAQSPLVRSLTAVADIRSAAALALRCCALCSLCRRRGPQSELPIPAAQVWLARGYAVLDGPSLPIVADEATGAEPNDTYLQQVADYPTLCPPSSSTFRFDGKVLWLLASPAMVHKPNLTV